MASQIVAVLAHESAQPTVDEFLPQWRKLPCPLRCYVPEGHTINGFDDVRQIGQSAHAGFLVFRRFIDTCRDLLRDEHDHYIIIEYDTVNITADLPALDPRALVGWRMWAPPHNMADGEPQSCILSPWCFPRAALLRFVAQAEVEIAADPESSRFSGLLDRWIGWVALRSGIMSVMGRDLLGYPYFNGVHDEIRRTGAKWVHGWKHKEDFEDLWPQG